ncbi:MAG TPA: hypothetical protein VF341_13115 [Anaeromyxobacteraceae bacterium]
MLRPAFVFALVVTASSAWALETEPLAQPQAAVVPASPGSFPVAPSIPGRASEYRDLEHRRGGWYIGFGAGGGGGNVTVNGQNYGMGALVGQSDGAFGMNLRVGGTITPELLLGFDGGFLSTATSGAMVQLNRYDVGVMYFPWQRGFYLRGAVGLAALTIDATGGGGILTGKGTTRGLDALAGVGYAFWVGRSFNLTVNADLDLQTYGNQSSGADVTSARGGSLWLGFDWY